MEDFDSIMIDWETMGTGPRAAVVQLGAVRFNSISGEICPRTFLMDVDLVSSINAGAYADHGTQDWWRERGGFKPSGSLTNPPRDVRTVIGNFYVWANRPKRVWAQGPSFDVAIMEYHCHCLRVDVPWDYHAARDTRTVYDLARQMGWEKPAEEVAHQALEDCQAQVRTLMSALAVVRRA